MPFHKKPQYPWVYADYYDSFDFYNGRDAWLSSYNRAPENGRNLFCVHWTYLEVANGGFWQFFFNSTGVMAPEAVVGFEAIKMSEVAAIVRAAMNKLPKPFPTDKEERQRLVGEPGQKGVGGLEFAAEDEKFWELTVPPKLFFSKPRYYDYADNYARESGGLTNERA